jgi:D-sedoheptulose 7-phosphate isomerase
MQNELIQMRFTELSEVISRTAVECELQILEVSKILITAFSNNNKLLICGNGGSAADSQHFATEFMSTFSPDIKRPGIPAIALSTDTSMLTAFANDYGFEGVFARQVEALGNEGDVLIVITTSGASKNCFAAVEIATQKNLITIAMTRAGGAIAKKTNMAIEIPSDNTQHIQEAFIASYHVICEIVETSLERMRK